MLQVVEQPVEVLSLFRTSLSVVAEQVIEVPMLSLPVCDVQRVVPPVPQLAEQLVEVPTPFFIFERNVDGTSTIQFRLVVVLVEIFLVCSVLWSRSLTLPFQVVLVCVVLRVYTQDRAQCSELNSPLTFQFPVVVLLVVFVLWNRPHTFQFPVVEVIEIFSRNRA